MNQDATPLAGSSQNSQRNKRKLADPEDAHQNASKRNYVDESNILQRSDSIFDQSEFPSQLASPSVVIPPRPNKKNKKRISTTQFMEVIQSQTSQIKEVESTNDLGESSIPSILGSPDEVLLQRPERQKKRISMSAFSRTLGKKTSQEVLEDAPHSLTDSSSMESSGIPSNLESPDYITSQQPAKFKKRVSSTGFRKIFDNSNVTQNQDKKESPEQSSQENSNISEMENPVLISTHLGSNKTNKKISTSFDKILHKEEPQIVNADVDLQEKTSHPSFNVSTLRSSMEKRSSVTASALGLSDPPATHTIEETNFQNPNIPSLQPIFVSDDNSSLDQYLSRSGEESTSDSLANTVEFTVRSDEPAPAIETSLPTVAPEGVTEILRENMVQRTPIREKRVSTVSTEQARSSDVYLDSTVALKQRESAEVQSKSHRFEIDSDLSDSDSNMPGLESPRAFSPIASSTQLIRRQPSMVDTTVTAKTTIEEQPETAARISEPSLSSPQKEISVDNSSSSDFASDIPSRLESPSDYKEYRRPGPSVSKKRISTTGFIAALSQKSAQAAISDFPTRALSPLPPKTAVPSTPVGSQTTETRRKSTVTPKVDETVTDSSRRASSKLSPVSPKRSATTAIPESGITFKAFFFLYECLLIP